jgi:hypothetical protein
VLTAGHFQDRGACGGTPLPRTFVCKVFNRCSLGWYFGVADGAKTKTRVVWLGSFCLCIKNSNSAVINRHFLLRLE